MKTQKIQFVKKSSNSKTGPIPVTTTSRNSCPDSCPLKGGSCYAESGFYTKLNWNKVDGGERGAGIPELSANIRQLPAGQLWRHNQAGDLPGRNNRINKSQLAAITAANKGKRGFTYTHKPTLGDENKATEKIAAGNRAAIAAANEGGFTVNLSGNSLAHADRLAALGIGPVVSIVPLDWQGNGETPAGRKVIQCPATAREDITCADCGLCQWKNRAAIIAFPAHGPSKKAASEIAAS